MKKTKINFEDIKAGDLLEVVDTDYGVKTVVTGIAFEKVELHGHFEWRTSQGGTVAGDWEESALYRIDVIEAHFDDVVKGDKLKVTTVHGNVTTIVEGVATARVNESVNPYWTDGDGHILTFKHVYNSVQTIEILEAGE